jgi:hypothetical protein
MLSALQPNDPTELAAYLRTLPAIRDRCGQVFDLAKAGKLQYFEYHPEKEDTVAEFCDALISVCTFGLWIGCSADEPWR